MSESAHSGTPPLVDAEGFAEEELVGFVEADVVGLADGGEDCAVGELVGPAAPGSGELPRPVSSQRTPSSSVSTTTSTRARRTQ